MLFKKDTVGKGTHILLRNRLICSLDEKIITIMADRASGIIEAAKQALKTKQPLYVALGDNLNALYKECRELIAYGARFLTKNSALAMPTYTSVNPSLAGHQIPHPFTAPQNTFAAFTRRILPL
ncbi:MULTISPECIES: DNA-processing protein DprA [unclassified Bartonella]|uniref:DNA-processing protein DprA n=1 Tax=unclassified Bartonella TaxID=2645622 RepID=UPI0035CFEE98